MKVLHSIAFILVIVGALNWLLVGINPTWDLVAMLLGGSASIVSKVVYILVGLSGIYLVVTHKNDCRHCETSATPSM